MDYRDKKLPEIPTRLEYLVDYLLLYSLNSVHYNLGKDSGILNPLIKYTPLVL